MGLKFTVGAEQLDAELEKLLQAFSDAQLDEGVWQIAMEAETSHLRSVTSTSDNDARDVVQSWKYDYEDILANNPDVYLSEDQQQQIYNRLVESGAKPTAAEVRQDMREERLIEAPGDSMAQLDTDS